MERTPLMTNTLTLEVTEVTKCRRYCEFAEKIATNLTDNGAWVTLPAMCTTLHFDAALGEEFFQGLPAAPAVFALRAAQAGAEPYVSKTANLRRRLLRLLGAPADGGTTKRLSLRERVASIEYKLVGGDFEAGFVLYQWLRREFPAKYAERLHLRAAPLLHLHMENRYPRLSVTSRIRSLKGGHYYGPFATRAEADEYANNSLDFFLLRRCTEELTPDGKFPGCVYSEMKMCLAPCNLGCTDERYAEESARVEQYLGSAGHSLFVEIGRLRDAASERLEFETAAAEHARLEKVKAVQQHVAEIVRRVDQLNGVLLQPSHQEGHIELFPIVGGMICHPVAFNVMPRPALAEKSAEGQPQTSAPHAESPNTNHSAGQPARTTVPQSMEARLHLALAGAQPAQPHSATEWMEHLALLKRWYYRTAKVGEIFFEDEHHALPMRRVVRAVGRVYKGEKPAGELNETAGDYWAFRAKEAGL